MSIENMTAREFLAALRSDTSPVVLCIRRNGDVILETEDDDDAVVRIDSPTLIADLLGRTDGES